MQVEMEIQGVVREVGIGCWECGQVAPKRLGREVRGQGEEA